MILPNKNNTASIIPTISSCEKCGSRIIYKDYNIRRESGEIRFEEYVCMTCGKRYYKDLNVQKFIEDETITVHSKHGDYKRKRPKVHSHITAQRNSVKQNRLIYPNYRPL